MYKGQGRAGVTKKLTVPATGPVEKQILVLDAGGLVLNAVSGNDVRIQPAQLRFNIFKAEDAVDDDRQLVVEDVKPVSYTHVTLPQRHQGQPPVVAVT